MLPDKNTRVKRFQAFSGVEFHRTTTLNAFVFKGQRTYMKNKITFILGTFWGKYICILWFSL